MFKKPLLFLFLMMQYAVFSQVETRTYSVAKTIDNIDPRIKEYLGDNLSKVITDEPHRIVFLTDLLENRLTFLDEKPTANEKYPKLSDFIRLQSISEAIDYSSISESKTFNILMYNLPFYNMSTKVIRIDNTDKILVIQPQIRLEILD